jgi:hypothetical protein
MRSKLTAIACLITFTTAQVAPATVFINEVFINPPGSSNDDTREFVELMGTPGMKLDGFAFTLVNGSQRKLYPLNSMDCNYLINQAIAPEIDEFFSLDGLQLGPNGILVLGIGPSGAYPTLLADTNFRRWTTLWQSNPGDPHGKLSNDGSNTALLIRNRPGETEATGDSGDVRWGKDRVQIDTEVLTPVDANICIGGSNAGSPCQDNSICVGGGTCEPGQADQLGDGNLDKGEPNGMASPCGPISVDLKGASTPNDVSDDLEVVDEVSYEHDQGWEYDLDARHVDLGSTSAGLPYRHVHAIDDPQGINPDAFSRVDYRTKGPGWPPVPGATGEMADGNNWQDTATEQWIRGESCGATATCPPPGGNPAPPFFFDNCPNANPDSIQPYLTNVPRWLNDGVGADYNFLAQNTYEIMAGRVNPLAIPFIPGDADRDGACDAVDIAKIAAAFGDDDWIFSNSFSDAPEGDGGDPAEQTRPWDVNLSGDNGIEPTDLQWALNFQGSTDGRIVGMRYDSTTPSATGVHLNPGAGVHVAVTAAADSPCGRPTSALFINDLVELTVRAQVTAGANTSPGQENGVMQFVHDVSIGSGGVLELVGVQAIGEFQTTRAAIQSPQGTNGELGVTRVNGYATAFDRGLGAADAMYRVTFRAKAAGSTSISVAASAEAKFVDGTPHGVKVGHTRDLQTISANNIATVSVGDPASAGYPAALNVTVTSGMLGDVDGDTAVTLDDVPMFVDVLLGFDTTPAHVAASDMNCDQAVNGLDVAGMVQALIP